MYGGVPPLATMLVFLGRPTAKAGRPSVMIVNVDLFVSGLGATDFVVAAFRGVDFFLVAFFAADFFAVDFFVAVFFVGDFFFMSEGPFLPIVCASRPRVKLSEGRIHLLFIRCCAR